MTYIVYLVKTYIWLLIDWFDVYLKNNVQPLLVISTMLDHKGAKVDKADTDTVWAHKQEKTQLQHAVMGFVWRQHVARGATQ